MSLVLAVLGTGRIGGTLGRAFAAAGHRVTFGARDPARDAEVVGNTGAEVARDTSPSRS